MRKLAFSLCVFLLLIGPRLAAGAESAPRVAPVREADMADLVAQVSPDHLQRHLCKLQDRDAEGYCNPNGSRYALDPQAQEEARGYIYQTLAALGLEVAYDPFVHSGQTLYNVVATLPGRDPASESVYILCAHYDSISAAAASLGPAPGADDNGSGVAALLEAARILRQRSFAHTIRFIALTGEELGLWGSAHYAAAAAARGEHIAGVFNLDMIGYDGNGDRAMELHAGADPASIALAEAFAANTQRYGINLLASQYTISATRQSDHASFWDQGYPAILLIESYFGADTNPHYHRTTDTLEYIAMPYLADFSKASIATLAGLARMWHSLVWVPLLSCRP